jgi:hypothetical protein
MGAKKIDPKNPAKVSTEKVVDEKAVGRKTAIGNHKFRKTGRTTATSSHKF